jgi:uncharacterized cupredoxin-like copper-binding protein
MDTQMAANPITTRPAGRKPLPALSKWTVATLVALALMLIWLQVAVVRGFSPPLALALGTPALIVAVPIVATRWRWAPLVGAIFWILLTVVNRRVIPYDITHPEFYDTFAFTVIVLAVTVVGIVAGIGATIQNYRAPMAPETEANQRRLPGWFPTLLWSLAALCAGALLVGAIPRTSAASSTTGVSPEMLAALPTLGMGHMQFEQQELRVKAGQMVALRLENHDDREHSFDIDEFNVHVPIGPGQQGLALFTPDQGGTYTFYCSVPGHRVTMVGTLVVEP